ncbi:hypothetical protein L9F63_004542, partial [Diploptera punctata]
CELKRLTQDFALVAIFNSGVSLPLCIIRFLSSNQTIISEQLLALRSWHSNILCSFYFTESITEMQLLSSNYYLRENQPPDTVTPIVWLLGPTGKCMVLSSLRSVSREHYERQVQ